MFTSSDDLVEEMPVVDALGAFLQYLDLTDHHAMDAKLHRSGRHPDDLHWSANPKYPNKMKVAGRITSTDDSNLFLKLDAENKAKEKHLKEKNKKIHQAEVELREVNSDGDDDGDLDSARGATSKNNLKDSDLVSIFRAYGKFRPFKPKPRASFKGVNGSYERADRPERRDVDAGTGEKISVTPTLHNTDLSTPTSGVWELDALGWQKLVRDCSLLDNSTTSVDLDDVFTRVDAGEIGFDERNRDERRRRAATAAAFGDAKLEFAEFKVALKECAKRRYVLKGGEDTRKNTVATTSEEIHAKTTAKVDAAYTALLRNDILPKANRGVKDATKKGDTHNNSINTGECTLRPTLVKKHKPKSKEEEDLEALYSQPALRLLRKYGTQLRRLYAHYATLETFSATTKKITWRIVEETNATLNRDEFLCFLVNFDVVPHLLSRDECLAVFRQVEAENDGDGLVDEMAYPSFLETLGRLSQVAFANAVPVLRNKRSDVFAVRSFKKLVTAAPKELWELGTLGSLFRRRGFFTGKDGGVDLTRHRKDRGIRIAAVHREGKTLEGKHLVGIEDADVGLSKVWQYGPGSREANYNKKGRVSDLHDPLAYEHDLYVHAHANQWTREDQKNKSIENAHEKSAQKALLRNPGSLDVPNDGSVLPRIHGSTPTKSNSKKFTPKGWVPSGKSDDIRSPGAGGLKAAYGYQQSPSVTNLEWRHNEKRKSAPAPRMRLQVANELGITDPDSRYASKALEHTVMGGTHRDSDDKVFATLNAAREKYTTSVLSPSGNYDLSGETIDRLNADRAWQFAEQSAINENTGRPWVHSSIPSYDWLRPEEFNLTKSFHSTNDGSMTHKAKRDFFQQPIEKKVPLPKRSVAFDPPVERPGYDEAVGGMLVSKKNEYELEDEEYEPPSDDDDAHVEQVVDAMGAMRAMETNGTPNSKNQDRVQKFPVITSPGSRRPVLNHTSPMVQTKARKETSKSLNSPTQDAVRIASPGTYAYGIGTSFARPGEVLDPGVAFGHRALIDNHSFPGNTTKPRRRHTDFASLPHPEVAAVSNLQWFENIRGKALRQRGLPSTKFLSTWREKLGTKEQRLKDEADVETIQRGLRARIGGD